MLSILALTIKKIITLLVLVGPISMIPIFLANTDGLDLRKKFQFARTIGISVTLVLLIATFLGMPILELLGISLGAMQIGGGIIVLLLAIAMVLGKESTFKGSPFIVEYEAKEISIVPLAVPLLAGPAAFSYVMGNGTWNSSADLIHIVLPTIAAGIACWFTFHMASQAEKKIQQSTLDVVQRIGGFILAAIAIEMIAIGLRGLFPILVTT